MHNSNARRYRALALLIAAYLLRTTPALAQLNPTGRALLGEQATNSVGITMGTDFFMSCFDLGSHYVMVGIDGKEGEVIDKLRVACAPIDPKGVISSTITWLGPVGADNLATPFTRRCASGSVVNGLLVTLRPYRPPTTDEPKFVANLRVQCAPMYATGLTLKRIQSPAGTMIIPPANYWLPQVGKTVTSGGVVYYLNCEDGRPAKTLRGLLFNYPYPFDSYLRWMISKDLKGVTVVGRVQMFCQQPDF